MYSMYVYLFYRPCDAHFASASIASEQYACDCYWELEKRVHRNTADSFQTNIQISNTQHKHGTSP